MLHDDPFGTTLLGKRRISLWDHATWEGSRTFEQANNVVTL